MPRSNYSYGTATNGAISYVEPLSINTVYFNDVSEVDVKALEKASEEAKKEIQKKLEEKANRMGGMQSLQMIEARAKKIGEGIHPELYFRYCKKNFGILEGMKLNARLKKLESAFGKAVENGQDRLGEKLMEEVIRETKESMAYAKGFKLFIEQEVLQKHKRNIRGGHISDTRFEDYTRVIPDDILAKKEEASKIFDGFIIYHVWDNEAEKKREKNQKMDEREKSRMKDPVLFGYIRESTRLYFIADWVDELCDLTFEEMVDVLSLDEKDITIPREPKLNI